MKYFISLLLLISFCSCKTSDHVKVRELDQDCERLIAFLNMNDEISSWLLGRPSKCHKIHTFLNGYDNNSDSVTYIKEFLVFKMQNEEYKLDRFIELYCLLHENPDAIIDGSLDK